MKKCVEIIASVASCGLLFSGCSTPTTRSSEMGSVPSLTSQSEKYAAGYDPRLRPFLLALYLDGEWGAVLRLEELGLAAMELQQFDLARKSFDAAIQRVEAIYADDDNAKRARSVFNAESVKDFKGEPYERSMLYFYRGLLYVQEDDYQNARASFLAADRHDTLSSAEEQKYAGDFGMMKYLAGWASYCDRDATRGGQLVEEAKRSDPGLSALPDEPPSALLLMDVGRAPLKYGEGRFSELLKVKAAGSAGLPPTVRKSTGETIRAEDWVGFGDVAFQATTRGGREVDAILAGKATFKDNAGVVRDVGVQAGSLLAMQGAADGNRGMMNFGLFGMLTGMAAAAVEASTTPAADTRAWSSLPEKVLLHHGTQPSADPLLLSREGLAAPQRLPLQVSHGGCTLAWGRTESALTPEDGGVAQVGYGAGKEPQPDRRNKDFRTMLVEQFASSAEGGR